MSEPRAWYGFRSPSVGEVPRLDVCPSQKLTLPRRIAGLFLKQKPEHTPYTPPQGGRESASPSDTRTWLRAGRRVGFAVAATSVVFALALELTFRCLDPLPMARVENISVTVLDHNDTLLRAYTTADERWRLPVATADVDPLYLKMLIAFEDRRFYAHPGVDPVATLRAIGQFARYGRIISGSSTLTMQVSRLLDGVHARDSAGKLKQMVRALQIERQYSKSEVLRLYFLLAPFGGNLEGVRAASLAYFGKEPRRLSPAEAALLVAIPQAPESRKPDRSPKAARIARDRVLARAVAAGVIKSEDATLARNEPIPETRREFAKLSPHLADAEREAEPARHIHRLTLDAKTQAALEILARDHARGLGLGLSAAVIAVDHKTGDILAEIGSAGLLDETRAGAVNMARAVRSPGSTLKPLIYGLAFEAGLAHPDTLIEDRPQRFGTYVPKNFDRDWHGTVTIREALAQSLNIPAVSVLEAVGPLKFYGRMKQAGLDPQLPKDAEPTLPIALGGLGLRLIDLAQLYASIARGGDTVTLQHRRATETTATVPPKPQQRLLDPIAAWYLADILRRAPAPANAKTGQIAFKTGTSYGTRDAWAVGFDGKHTIAVWVGRADGASVPGLAGRASAAPLLFDAFQRLGEQRTALPSAPRDALKATAANLPPPLRRFNPPTEAADAAGATYRTAPLRIAFPPDRAELDASDDVTFTADGGALPLTWLVDGVPTTSTRRELTLPDKRQGFLKIAVIDANGRSDRITVRLK
jgi:penicillin-binding protein 1C